MDDDDTKEEAEQIACAMKKIPEAKSAVADCFMKMSDAKVPLNMACMTMLDTLAQIMIANHGVEITHGVFSMCAESVTEHGPEYEKFVKERMGKTEEVVEDEAIFIHPMTTGMIQ